MKQIKTFLTNNKYIFPILFLSCGICIAGILQNSKIIRYDNEVNIVQFLNVIITFVIAYFVTIVIQRENQNEARYKDLLLKRIEEVEGIMSLFSSVKNKENFNEFVSILTRFKRKLKNISNVLVKIGLQKKDNSVDVIVKQLWENSSILLDLTTYTPQEGVIIYDSIITFTEDHVRKINNQYDKIIDQLDLLRLSIISLKINFDIMGK